MTVPWIIISAMCARELSVRVFILIEPHIIAFFMGLGSFNSSALSRARQAALPQIFSYSSCWRRISALIPSSSISGRMSEIDSRASWQLR
ncbi:MAG: hypothetical protein ACLSTV_06400 [Coriobacteriales bacterium]